MTLYRSFLESVRNNLTLLLVLTTIILASICISFIASIIQGPLVMLPVLLFMSLPFYCLSRIFSRRISQLTKAVNSWSQGDFSAMVQENGRDEIGQLALQLNNMAQQLQHDIAMRQELAASNERNHLARELHDTVKQQVFALGFQLEIARQLHQSKNDQLAMHLREAQNILQDIQKEMSNLIFPMRQAMLANKDLTDSLANYLSRWSYQYGIFVRYRAEIQGQEKNFSLPARVKETFFRVAQEALSNVARHSKASSVKVTLTIGWLYITLTIVDDGVGFDFAKRKASGIGLSSMEERMQAIGGQLQITSNQPSGTMLEATYAEEGAGPNVAEILTVREEKPLVASFILPSRMNGKIAAS
jgi:NarL family two-component system sensor histidine kinase LiaS